MTSSEAHVFVVRCRWPRYTVCDICCGLVERVRATWMPTARVYLHSRCFVNFSAWYETQRNLRRIVKQWSGLTPTRKKRSQVFECWSHWAFRNAEAGRARRMLQACFEEFKSLVPPGLVSSSDSDVPPRWTQFDIDALAAVWWPRTYT